MTESAQPGLKLMRNAAPSIYVEGLSQLMIGFPNSRMLFHSFAAPAEDGKPEVRTIACELVIPTNALVETTLVLVNQIARSKGLLGNAATEWAAKVTELFDSVQPVEAAGLPTPTTLSVRASLDP